MNEKTEKTVDGDENANAELSQIESIADLEKLVLEWEGNFFDPSLGYPAIWYRGQGQDIFPQPGILRSKFMSSCDEDDAQILPTLYRLWNKERTINRQFRRMVANLCPTEQLVELYMLAQHYKLPTRLLDWTMNPLAALYFAVSSSPEEDGVIFVMNPKQIAGSGKVSTIAGMRDKSVVDIVKSLFGDHEIAMDGKVIPIFPDYFSSRLIQQSSCFTFHTPQICLPSSEKNEEGKIASSSPLADNILKKHIIPKDKKSEIKITLRRMGVTVATLFPDMDNIALEIKNAWKL